MDEPDVPDAGRRRGRQGQLGREDSSLPKTQFYFLLHVAHDGSSSLSITSLEAGEVDADLVIEKDPLPVQPLAPPVRVHVPLMLLQSVTVPDHLTVQQVAGASVLRVMLGAL